MGSKETSAETSRVEKGEILYHRRRRELGVSGNRRRQRGPTPTSLSPESLQCAHQEAYENPRRRQSLRSSLGNVLRTPIRCEDGGNLARTKATSHFIQGARGNLSTLSAEDHRDNRVAS